MAFLIVRRLLLSSISFVLLAIICADGRISAARIERIESVMTSSTRLKPDLLPNKAFVKAA